MCILGHGRLSAQTAQPHWDTYPDTWVATDALGRTLPGYAQVGGPRRGKTVGMFYFTTADAHGDGPYDNTQILRTHPEALNDVTNPAWGPLNTSHYWGEPLFGYYTSDDDYVLRKHAQMLANAGVDVVIFDNSNAVTYDHARNTLCWVWEQMRRAGLRTPQIAFLCPFGNPDSIGTKTVRELYDTLYTPGKYRDLWFVWKGKPLILADPSYASPLDTGDEAHFPAELHAHETLGQTFHADHPFISVGGEFPTWNTTGSGMTMSLYRDGPSGKLISRKHLDNVPDNAAREITVPKPLPAGTYYLEISQPMGRIGWWSYESGTLPGSHAYEAGEPTNGCRSLHLLYAGQGQPQTLFPASSSQMHTDEDRVATHIRQFFTFRTPIAPYNLKEPPFNNWAWLQVFPQMPQRDATGHVEQVSVGVAQNYNATVNNTAPMSFPGAFGRSYHHGKTDKRPGAVNWGFNFDEQWQRARQINPPFVFITGWNEWTAGFYDSWAGFHEPPAIFVDEFNQEDSRDIEPMVGGHGDDYYYQLVSEVRRYKGVRPLPPITPRPITIDGKFDEWHTVQPEFRDAIGDPTQRNSPGVGHAGPYKNNTGRNDIVAAKVSYDAKNIYFYVRTRARITPHTDPDWMRLYLNTDASAKTGWLGYDYLVNGSGVGDQMTTLARNVGGRDQWRIAARIRYAVRGNEMEIAIPRKAVGLNQLPSAIDFKWADHCHAKGDWTDFTLNGDAAPDDRFNYRAKFVSQIRR